MKADIVVSSESEAVIWQEGLPGVEIDHHFITPIADVKVRLSHSRCSLREQTSFRGAKSDYRSSSSL
ncbi:MAG: hypothetical protein CMJ64_26910 [Planctomycetaceae bacterium]|nr:hypothetical protein [Planctomycetaceae bacterium]